MTQGHVPPEAAWRKSSYSGTGGGACVEVAPDWRKSSYSGGSSANCVEIGHGPRAIGVRDSKQRDAGILTVSPAVWAAFVGGVRRRKP